MVKKVQLYVNLTKKRALTLSEAVRHQLVSFGYDIIENGDDEPDFVIGFGGDGTLLKWLNTKNYNTSAKYIGVNCGTLGFMQEFSIIDIEKFVADIPQYVEQKLNFVSLELIAKNKKSRYYALNEFNILNSEDKSFRANIEVGNEFLQKYVGTGMIFSTSTGSTAHNISSIGSIMFPNIEAIQMTPSEAIINGKLRCLSKSIVIPKKLVISLRPMVKDKIKLIADGQRIYEGTYETIRVSYSPSYVTILTDPQHTFIRKIREKLI
ncbi:MAG: NAD(+)/NADH kinase [Clostridia bacterium]|nr:NAD(+)/NADH kinase [Clostridia bacterium]